MAQRLVRQGEIRDAGIPYGPRTPTGGPAARGARRHLPDLQRGYTATPVTTDPVRLCRRRSGSGLLAELMPDDPRWWACSLMLLTESRRPRDHGGRRVLRLAEQDRARWDRALVDEGQLLVRRCLRAPAGPYQLQARSRGAQRRATAAATDWNQILALYDQLVAIAPGPVVALHRAVAVAEVHGPRVALALLDELDLDAQHLFHAVRADLLRRLGRVDEAASAYSAALERTHNTAEQNFLRRALADLRAVAN